MANEDFSMPPSLPPYPQMILCAIEELNETNGSNKTSISKYIEAKFGDLPPGHTSLVSNHLTRMKHTGELIFWKNNYYKPDMNAPQRRGRGRPPKPKDPSMPSAAAAAASVSHSATGRPRGRPPKDPDAPPKPKIPSATGTPRGRPRKMACPNGGISTGSGTSATGSGRPRGRPPKMNNTAAGFTELSIDSGYDDDDDGVKACKCSIQEGKKDALLYWSSNGRHDNMMDHMTWVRDSDNGILSSYQWNLSFEKD
ncbi:hypothetical protein ACFE04_009527 [Oxalis oulophora]